MTGLGLWMFPALLVQIVAGIPIAFALMSTALVFGLLRFGDAAVHQFVSKIDDVSSNYVLGAIPLFIFMGALLERSGIADRLFAAIYMWTKRLPGALALSAIIMCTVFAAATGVAGATETVVGLLAIPPMLKHAYDRRLISGTICAGGSLGTMIPPSITVIVLAPIANQPVGDLFAGIMLPGLIMASLFAVYIVVGCWLRPERAPRPPVDEDEHIPLLEKLSTTAVALLLPTALIFVVLGTILLGWATPTEAAACGALGSFLLAAAHRRIDVPVLREALFRTLSVTAMILLIVVGGSMFSGVFYASGGMQSVQYILSEFGLAGWPTIALLLGLTFLAGFLLDLISVVLILIPIAMPLVSQYGVDPLWFCVLFLIVLQTSYLTPPMAPAIFYMRAVAPPSITLMHMYRGVVPFILLELITLAIAILFPGVATWLPRQLYG